MNGKKNIVVTILLVVSVSLFSVMLSAVFLLKYYSRVQFQMLSGFCQMLAEERIADRDAFMGALKENREKIVLSDNGDFLESFGYRADDFAGRRWETGYLIAAAGLGTGLLIFMAAFLYWHKKEGEQISALTEYLEKVNTGRQGLLLAARDGEYSRLQDEIYKTVTTLYQTRDAALEAKNNYADNLYNIAHQLKTPITAISLSAQLIEEKSDLEYAGQIRKQVARLTHLEEALLLLSRIDTGTLTLEKVKLDVFTMLTLAADNLQELSVLSDVELDISDHGEAVITADMEWTMEAVMNLLKNCMEHSPAGARVHCSYEQNPLYVQIRIWDEGEGFEKKDIPHLFERFYRGENAVKGSIGIGLSISKAIIEMQNGVVHAGNLPEGGAFFEIRMYSH